MSESHALRVDRAREAQPNGWWGIALFVATEATLFGTLIGSYVYLRFNTLQWPPPGTPDPKVVVPLVLAAVLALTVVPMVLAVRAAREGRRGAAWLLVALALVVQAGYFAMQVHLFYDDLARFTPQESSYGSIYFTMTGADHAHVAVGLLLDLWLLARLSTRLTKYRLTGLRVVAFYWYFVAATTVAVTLTQVSPSL